MVSFAFALLVMELLNYWFVLLRNAFRPPGPALHGATTVPRRRTTVGIIRVVHAGRQDTSGQNGVGHSVRRVTARHNPIRLLLPLRIRHHF